MAATDRARLPAATGSAILAAALALPGVAAHAEAAPADGVISLKLLQYQDEQPDLKRVHVSAPSVYVLAPLGERWSIEGSGVLDSVSGASPRYHTAVSGASRMHDERQALDGKLTHYGERATWGVGMALSSEHDYHSTALSLDGSLSSDDNNRTWHAGLGLTHDRVGSTNDLSLHQRKGSVELLAGVTQALSPVDLVQVDLTWQHGHGYYSDPYKELDVRPDKRTSAILLARWNHHVEAVDGTLRTSYRYYHDSFGISAHTLGAEWVQPVGHGLTLTPALRLYSQSAASFYFDPVYDKDLGAPYPPGYFTNPPTYSSPDQRLSAFGAITAAMKLGWQINRDWSADLKGERYAQRSDWRVGGNGSIGLAPFNASTWQLGVNTRF